MIRFTVFNSAHLHMVELNMVVLGLFWLIYTVDTISPQNANKSFFVKVAEKSCISYSECCCN